MAYKGKKLTELHGDALKARVAQLVASGNSQLVKDGTAAAAFLPAKTVAARVFNGPAVPGSTLTNRDVARQGNAAADLEYGGSIRQDGRDIAGQQAAASRNQGFYDQYQQALKDSYAAQQQGQQALAAQLGNINAGATGAGAQIAAAQNSAMQADAANRGATVSPTIAQTASDAAGVRAAGLASYGSQLLGSQATQGALLNQFASIAPKQKVEQAGRDATQLSKLQAVRADDVLKSNDLNVRTRQSVRDRENTNVLQSQVALAGIGAKTNAQVQEQQKADAAFLSAHGISYARYAKLTQSERAASDRAFLAGKTPPKPKTPTNDDPYLLKYGITKNAFLALPASQRQQLISDAKNKGSGNTDKDQYGNTGLQRRGARDAFTKALTTAQAVQSDDWRQVYQFLVIKKNYAPVVAQAAAQQSVLGYVGPTTAASLRRRGVSTGYTTSKPRQPTGAAGYGGHG